MSRFWSCITLILVFVFIGFAGLGPMLRQDLGIWADVMERLACGEREIATLLPDIWAASHPEAIRSYRAHERESKAAAKRARPDRRRALERVQAIMVRAWGRHGFRECWSNRCDGAWVVKTTTLAAKAFLSRSSKRIA